MEVEELNLEEFAKWMRRRGYSEETTRVTVSWLKTALREGTEAISKYARKHRRYALHRYREFLSS